MPREKNLTELASPERRTALQKQFERVSNDLAVAEREQEARRRRERGNRRRAAGLQRGKERYWKNTYRTICDACRAFGGWRLPFAMLAIAYVEKVEEVRERRRLQGRRYRANLTTEKRAEIAEMKRDYKRDARVALRIKRRQYFEELKTGNPHKYAKLREQREAAVKRYREKNREKVNAWRMNYYRRTKGPVRERTGRPGKPVWGEDRYYESVAKAAAEMGCSSNSIYFAMRTGGKCKGKTWRYAERSVAA
jgi:hypothetical protein